MSTPRPVLIGSAVLATAQFLAASAALSDIIGPDAFAIFVLVVGAVQVGWGVLTQGQVVPFSRVAARVDSTGKTIAGPASDAVLESSVAVVPDARLGS